jgi:PTS system galactitol-specific IIA component
MQLSDLLHSELIHTNLATRSRDEAIRTLAKSLKQDGYVDSEFAQAVLAREKSYPTGLPTQPHRIALPHTEAEHVNRSALAIGVLQTPVEFHVMGAPEETISAKIIFLLAIADKERQVKALAQLASVFQDGTTLDKIVSAGTPDEIIEVMNHGLREVSARSQS